MTSNKKQHRILYSLLFFFLMVGLVPLVITNFRLIFHAEEIMNKNLWDTQNRDVRKISTSIRTELQNLQDDIRLIAESQGINSLDIPARHLYLKFHKRRNQWIKHLYIKTILQNNETTERSVEDLNTKPSPEFLSFFSDKRMFQEVLAGREFHLGPYSSREREYLYGIEIIPIEDSDGVFIGALYCELELNFIIDFINENIADYDKQAFVIDQNQIIIAHPDWELFGKEVHKLDIDPATFVMFVASTFSFKNTEGEEFSGAYISIPDVKWWVVMYESSRNARWFISDMKWNATKIGLITALFSIILAAIFAGTLNYPIRQLSEAAMKIGDGHFDQRISIKSKNELGQLAETFNYMTGKLQEYTAQLEKYAKEMQELFFSSIQSLAAAIDEKDPYTRGHSERVTRYSTAIAGELGLNAKEIEEVRIAALLHDIGKIGIHDNVLGKPSKLNEEEIVLMQQHPVLGANIMSPIKQLRTIIPGMLEHHEKFNGSGYPYGLSGTQISLMGRIIAVSDTFDAMTTERPYQKSMPVDYVVEKIMGWKAERFDPEVVDAFVRAYKNELSPFFQQDKTPVTKTEHGKTTS